ncbi:MAG: iron-containing alcohol dehydrogenase [Coriobacteriales bacterium]
MQNFVFSVPTNIFFGQGQLDALPQVLGGYGKRILLVYGGNSAKASGLIDKIKGSLEGFEVFEMGGVSPNPDVASVREGAQICRDKQVEAVLAVGGGSVIDCCKAIAAAALYEGDAWQLVLEAGNPASGAVKGALPVLCVVTIAATGSDSNCIAVISNKDEKAKMGMVSPLLYPKASFLDPSLTFSVPAYQTASGAADTLSHIFEVYFNVDSSAVSDGIAESVMRTVIEYAPKALANPEDYEARANLMWAASVAMTNICSCGAPSLPWGCHSIEHELSAYYGVTHGAGLAVVTPAWMRFALSERTVARFAAYGVNVWGLDPDADQMETAKAAIERTAEFFASLGLPATLTEMGIDDEHFAAMAEHAATTGMLAYAYAPMTAADVEGILRACL